MVFILYLQFDLLFYAADLLSLFCLLHEEIKKITIRNITFRKLWQQSIHCLLKTIVFSFILDSIMESFLSNTLTFTRNESHRFT